MSVWLRLPENAIPDNLKISSRFHVNLGKLVPLSENFGNHGNRPVLIALIIFNSGKQRRRWVDFRPRGEWNRTNKDPDLLSISEEQTVTVGWFLVKRVADRKLLG